MHVHSLINLLQNVKMPLTFFILLYFRYWHQVFGFALFVHSGIEHLRLYTNYWQRTLWIGEAWPKLKISLCGQVWADIWCWSQAHCSTLLQIEIHQCSWVRSSQRFCHRANCSKLYQTEITWHWKVWHHRSWTQNSRRNVLKLKEI